MKRKSESKQLLDEEYNINGSAVVDSNVKKETAKETAKETIKESCEQSIDYCCCYCIYYNYLTGNFL